MAWRQRVDEASGDVFGTPVEAPPLAASGHRESDEPLAAVGGIDLDGDQLLVFELPEQPAEVTRVEAEAATEIPDSGAVGADLEQQA